MMKNLRTAPFPDGPQDGDVMFHNDMVYIYRADIQTWVCRRNLEPRNE